MTVSNVDWCVTYVMFVQFEMPLLWENIQRQCNAEGAHAQEEAQTTAQQQS